MRLLSPDNPIHASAAPPEAEHEIKLWFKPTDIPPFMRAFLARQNDEVYFYYKDGKLYATHEQGSTCVFAPGDIAWDSDVKALQFISQGNRPLILSRSSLPSIYRMRCSRISRD